MLTTRADIAVKTKEATDVLLSTGYALAVLVYTASFVLNAAIFFVVVAVSRSS